MCTQRDMLVTEATTSITAQITQGTTFFETIMELWSQVQRDPLLRQIDQELHQKEQDFEQMEATMPTLLPAQ